MNYSGWERKALVLTVIYLFIGVAFAPSINANISKPSFDEETVEYTTTICGWNGGKQIVTLTQEQSQEVEQIFNSMQEQLSVIETDEAAKEIFKQVVIALDKYGLLGGLSVKQAQNLVTNHFQHPKLMNMLERLYTRDNVNSNEDKNILCLMAGKVKSNVLFDNPLLYPLNILANILLNLNIIGNWIGYFIILVMAIWTINYVNPFCLGRSIRFYESTEGDIISFGLLGLKNLHGSLEGLLRISDFEGIGVIGFTGLKIQIISGWVNQNSYFLGGALLAHIQDS